VRSLLYKSTGWVRFLFSRPALGPTQSSSNGYQGLFPQR